MAALVCDICGGKLSMGSGGIAVCESCGMEHTKERLQEKIQEIKGTVRIDNSHMVENYLNIARTAYDASNLAEAESYCNKVIEISPINPEAWLIKGKAAGWQSTLSNLRFSESIAAFSKAISNTAEEERPILELETINEIGNISRAVVSLRGDRFIKFPDEDETAGLLKDLVTILNTLEQYYQLVSMNIQRSQIMGPIASQIDEIVNVAWENKIIPEYRGDENKPDKHDFDKYLNRIGYCTDLLDIAIKLSSDDDEDDIYRYEMLIRLEQAAIYSCSWDYEYSQYGGKVWSKDYTLTDQAIEIRKKSIESCRTKISEIRNRVQAEENRKRVEKEMKEKEEAERRYNDYWAGHTDEKMQIEGRIQTLMEQIAAENAEIQKLQSNVAIHDLEVILKQLQQERAALGLFNRQEKKAKQEKIDAITLELSNLTKTRDASIQVIREKQKSIEFDLDANRAELLRAR